MTRPPTQAKGAVPALCLSGVVQSYALPRRRLYGPAPRLTALSGVDVTLAVGETLGVVGESGSGKSTVARIAMALERPDSGKVEIAGQDPWALSPTERRHARARFQMVFQDPMGSLNPRRPAGWSVAEPLLAMGVARQARAQRAQAALASVGLPDAAPRFPHEFSGGQRQRIAIARAIVSAPALIVADEPVSALDVSVQAQILNLLMEVQAQTGAALLLISHDLDVVGAICDRVLVLHQGRAMAQGPVDEILRDPPAPYQNWARAFQSPA
ncbi:MAG: dipeptide/oligopeptide/nickel ABC transporter ATP-binding protein [Pseudomonadota bacterium]